MHSKEVISLMSSLFASWVLIAGVSVRPLACNIMRNWLQDFAYRTDINICILVASGAMALAIALLTVSSHAIKAATANPVESLRYE
jgi:putative ABC transport system permease protein